MGHTQIGTILPEGRIVAKILPEDNNVVRLLTAISECICQGLLSQQLEAPLGHPYLQLTILDSESKKEVTVNIGHNDLVCLYPNLKDFIVLPYGGRDIEYDILDSIIK